VTCDHTAPDRLPGEPPSACRACRRAKYRATSTRPRRIPRDELERTRRRHVDVPVSIADRIDVYADERGLSNHRAILDLLAAGIASVLVDAAIGDGPVSDPGRFVHGDDR
jgi:hypothetical protein